MWLAIVTVSLSRYESHENVINVRKTVEWFLSSSPAVALRRAAAAAAGRPVPTPLCVVRSASPMRMGVGCTSSCTCCLARAVSSFNSCVV